MERTFSFLGIILSLLFFSCDPSEGELLSEANQGPCEKKLSKLEVLSQKLENSDVKKQAESLILECKREQAIVELKEVIRDPLVDLKLIGALIENLDRNRDEEFLRQLYKEAVIDHFRKGTINEAAALDEFLKKNGIIKEGNSEIRSQLISCSSEKCKTFGISWFEEKFSKASSKREKLKAYDEFLDYLLKSEQLEEMETRIYKIPCLFPGLNMDAIALKVKFDPKAKKLRKRKKLPPRKPPEDFCD